MAKTEAKKRSQRKERKQRDRRGGGNGSRREKAAKPPADANPVGPPGPAAPAERAGHRIAGQRFYDLPYSAPAPRLVNPELGLHNLVARAGHNAAYEIDVTLLDAPDHRLIRSGVLLAHRVLDGRGEWFLTAPDWQPLLPKDRIELMGHADLPEDLADLIRPLRRRATLGPVAALNCDRREFALRDDRGSTMALLRDDKVTVRRGGLTTARYREVMITPIGPGLSEEQSAFLDRALVQAGATFVPRLPRLVTRLGAPATGPTDLPLAAPYDAAAPLRRFVSQLLAVRLRRIVEADLALRGGQGPIEHEAGVGRLAKEAAQLRTELTGLSVLLDADWVEDLYDELGWITADSGSDEQASLDRLTARLRSERYLTLLERLVAAVRSPRLADLQPQATGDALRGLLALAVGRLQRVADRLTVESGHDTWEDAWLELGRLTGVTEVVGQVLPEESEQLEHCLAPLRELLAEVRRDQAAEVAAVQRAAALPPELAFVAGRDFERDARRARRARRDLVRLWSRTVKNLPA